jgi:hypothetical protein
MQACLRCPGPPNLIMSWQARHVPQLVELQPWHSPHRLTLLRFTKRPHDIPVRRNKQRTINTKWMLLFNFKVNESSLIKCCLNKIHVKDGLSTPSTIIRFT